MYAEDSLEELLGLSNPVTAHSTAQRAKYCHRTFLFCNLRISGISTKLNNCIHDPVPIF